MISLTRVFILIQLFLAVPWTGFSAVSENVSNPSVISRAPLFDLAFKKKSTPLRAELQAEGMQYLTPLSESPDLNEGELLSVHVRYDNKNSWLQTSADVEAMTFLSPSESHILVQELYTTPQTHSWTGDFTLSLGRRLIPWSGADASWDLGLWQPYYELDALRLEQQGLTGAFFNFDQENFQLIGFATPFFVPNLGPSTREENGALITQSRWERLRPREARFGSGVKAMDYELEMPETSEIVQHAGYSLLARVGQRERGFWGTSSVGYKPVNELLISRSVQVPTETNRIRVQVAPVITYHTLFAADAGFSAESAGVSISYLQDQPEDLQPREGWSVQKLEPVRIISVGTYWQIPALMTRSVVVRVDHISASGGKIEDVGSDGLRDLLSQDESRLKFSQAVRVQAQGELLRIFRRPLFGEVSWLYDQEQNGTMLHSEIQYFPTTQWAVLAGVDFLGAEENALESEGFLNQFRANDRVYGGMAYVF